MEYGLIFHGTRTVKYYCKNMKYIYIYHVGLFSRVALREYGSFLRIVVLNLTLCWLSMFSVSALSDIVKLKDELERLTCSARLLDHLLTYAIVSSPTPSVIAAQKSITENATSQRAKATAVVYTSVVSVIVEGWTILQLFDKGFG